ncbi:MAG: ATP-binding protein, partial [Chloroflexi bacterium]|nr:ATP-binding protein [Chloroflexota bacterium]
MNERLYKMTISLNVLDHLGIGLYSNPAAVLSEIVANAWDADATQVTIDFNSEQKTITVTDNGIGMNYWDVNNKFLMVGYRKRDSLNDGVTESGRLPMRRKGIGKLSVFSIAEEVEVHTVKGASRNALKMRVADIQETIRRAGAAQED